MKYLIFRRKESQILYSLDTLKRMAFDFDVQVAEFVFEIKDCTNNYEILKLDTSQIFGFFMFIRDDEKTFCFYEKK
jgi:hypothetical protein